MERWATDRGGVDAAPIRRLDVNVPKALPNDWILGQVSGLAVDSKDHVWIIHRSSATLSNMEKGAELTLVESSEEALALAESGDVTGRVFEVEAGIIRAADGWQHGPAADKGARWEPYEVGDVVRRLMKEAPEQVRPYGA